MGARGLSDLARALLLLACAGGLALLAWATPVGGVIEDAAAGAAALGASPLAVPAFVAAYALAVAFSFPGTALTVIGGVAFGLMPGFFVNLAGGTTGAVLAHTLARVIGGDLLLRRAGPRIDAFRAALGFRRAFLLVLRLRLVPVLPSSSVSYAAGLVDMPLAPFATGTLLGIVPSTFLWTYFARVVTAGEPEARAAAVAYVAALKVALFLATYAPTLWRRWRTASVGRGATGP